MFTWSLKHNWTQTNHNTKSSFFLNPVANISKCQRTTMLCGMTLTRVTLRSRSNLFFPRQTVSWFLLVSSARRFSFASTTYFSALSFSRPIRHQTGASVHKLPRTCLPQVANLPCHCVQDNMDTRRPRSGGGRFSYEMNRDTRRLV